VNHEAPPVPGNAFDEGLARAGMFMASSPGWVCPLPRAWAMAHWVEAHGPASPRQAAAISTEGGTGPNGGRDASGSLASRLKAEQKSAVNCLLTGNRDSLL
jgi:hypothetical protein